MPPSNLASLEFSELEAHTAAIDWRSEESEVIESIAALLGPADKLFPIERGEALLFSWRGAEYEIPRTFTPHDRYVALSSLAAVMNSDYQFWLLTARLGDDTHSVLVLPRADSDRLEADHPGWVSETLTKFAPGKDQLSGLKVPYWGRRDNPSFRWEARKLRFKRRVFELLLRLLLRIASRRRFDFIATEPG